MTKTIKKQRFFLPTRRGVFEVVLRWDPRDKAYIVSVPSLPEIFTFGTSIAHARRMAKDAIELVCDSVLGDGNVVIDDKRRVVGRIPASRILSPVR